MIMNKNPYLKFTKLLLMTAALALSLPGVGCNKSDKLAQRSTFTPLNGPTELKWKWPKGELILQTMKMKENSELSIPGRPNPTTQEITMEQEFGLTVLKEAPDGGHELEMEFLSARLEAPVGSKTLANYDSTIKSPADNGNPVADMFRNIIGSKVQFFLDASNEVERIEGMERLSARLASSGQGNQLDGIRNLYSEGYLKEMMSRNRSLPRKPVQPGDMWPVHVEFLMGTLGTMIVDEHFTFQCWETHGSRNCARLEFEGTIANKPDTNSIPTRMSVSITSGKSSGVSWFDPELGMIIDTTVNHDMKLDIAVPVDPGGNPAATARMVNITSQMNQITNIKLKSVK